MMLKAIKFNYLFRDCGNYKYWGEVVLQNDSDQPLEIVEAEIREKLDCDCYFLPSEFRFPTLFFDGAGYRVEIENAFYELHCLEATDEEPNDIHGRTLTQFLSEIKEMLLL